MLSDLWSRYKKQILIVMASVSLLALFIQWRSTKTQNEWNLVDRIGIRVFGVVQNWTRDVSLGLDTLWSNYVSVIHASEENAQLKEELQKLTANIHLLQEIESENNRLRKLLNFSERLRHRLLPAQVVAENLQGELRTIRLNKGLKDGVKSGSAVVTNEGVVGKVIRLSDRYADVLTIIDANSSIDSLDQRTRARGVVEGRNINSLYMKYLQRDDDVLQNDTIVTTGLGGDYPKGIIVGRILKVERKEYGISQLVVLEPSVDFTRLEEVFIVTGTL